MKGRTFRFFITSLKASKASAEKPQSGSVYGYSDDNSLPCKEMPDVVLFGSMTQAYCKSLAVAVYHQEGVLLRVPSDYEHPGLHGDEVTLPYSELIKHLEQMVGPIDHLPPNAVIPMGDLFDYLKKQVLLKTPDKNPASPH